MDIQIPGYDVEYIASYERDMGFTSMVVYKATKEFPVYVGGVAMYDGEYLAVGATTTQTTKPSGGYAYYKDGKLTLHNYQYEGEGYSFKNGVGAVFGAAVYSGTALDVTLEGENTLNQTTPLYSIYSKDDLFITGDGSLHITQNMLY